MLSNIEDLTICDDAKEKANERFKQKSEMKLQIDHSDLTRILPESYLSKTEFVGFDFILEKIVMNKGKCETKIE
jgi:hypothetical protein